MGYFRPGIVGTGNGLSLAATFDTKPSLSTRNGRLPTKNWQSRAGRPDMDEIGRKQPISAKMHERSFRPSGSLGGANPDHDQGPMSHHFSHAGRIPSVTPRTSPSTAKKY